MVMASAFHLIPLQRLSVLWEYRERLKLPMYLLGVRFLHWLVVCVYTTSGPAGPCPSAWGLVLLCDLKDA